MGRVLTLRALSALAVFSGFASRLAGEYFREPEPAEAQSAQEEDLYDCKDFDTREQALTQLLSGDTYGLDDDGDGIACDNLPSGGSTTTGSTPVDSGPALTYFTQVVLNPSGPFPLMSDVLKHSVSNVMVHGLSGTKRSRASTPRFIHRLRRMCAYALV